MAPCPNQASFSNRIVNDGEVTLRGSHKSVLNLVIELEFLRIEAVLLECSFNHTLQFANQSVKMAFSPVLVLKSR
jgi:hypothetical protein